MAIFLEVDNTKFSVERTLVMRDHPIMFLCKAEESNKRCHYVFFELAKEHDFTEWLGVAIPTLTAKLLIQGELPFQDALYNSNKILVFHKDARTVGGYLRKAKDKDLEKVPKKKIFSAKTNF